MNTLEHPAGLDLDFPKLAQATICGVGTSVPEHLWTQELAVDTLAQHFEPYRRSSVRRMFANCAIDTRHFAVSAQDFRPVASPQDMHDLFLEAAPPLARDAAEKALKAADVTAQDIGLVVVATCTGYLCPGLTVHLMRDLGISDRAQRADLVGMGCAGAMPALQRGTDFVRGQPSRKALVVTVEICSACWFVDDSIETVVGNAICGDGAAALVLSGVDEESHHDVQAVTEPLRPTPQVLDFETLVCPDWMEAVGLENKNGRQRIILSKKIRHAAGSLVRQVVDRLLEKHQLKRNAIDHWVFHAGGAAVLSNIDKALDFESQELYPSREILRQFGNMSSPTTLFVLEEVHQNRSPLPGQLGIALALGPGLATEAALLRW